MRKRIARKLKAKQEAKALIPKLLKKSKLAYKEGRKNDSRTYSKKIRYLSMKYKLKLPKAVKRQLCKHCYTILIPGVNCRIRTKQSKLIIYCLDCKNYTRIPLK